MFGNPSDNVDMNSSMSPEEGYQNDDPCREATGSDACPILGRG
jgi:hypothetical protein